ncbi:hypothetical protein [Parendozoicomonas haliclonae]|uniref:Uncharacterized protein n=1 Tax=Parendozoicomonas haliclonae TaxID=1960125 RepID=A0A1X7APB2_9GAMM|nr:hypothetical protein [Parendozoicomonas haliclonae]SMA50095.1 hypothetical protein EHSB41UT_03886 [Parendozoicomonas haliclonae]
MKVKHLYVRDRITYERGIIEGILQKGWLKVRMEWGELRSYQTRDLLPCPNDDSSRVRATC